MMDRCVFSCRCLGNCDVGSRCFDGIHVNDPKNTHYHPRRRSQINIYSNNVNDYGNLINARQFNVDYNELHCGFGLMQFTCSIQKPAILFLVTVTCLENININCNYKHP